MKVRVRLQRARFSFLNTGYPCPRARDSRFCVRDARALFSCVIPSEVEGPRIFLQPHPGSHRDSACGHLDLSLFLSVNFERTIQRYVEGTADR